MLFLLARLIYVTFKLPKLNLSVFQQARDEQPMDLGLVSNEKQRFEVA